MKKIRHGDGKRKDVPALAPVDSLSMLRSAVGYVMQSGLLVQAKNYSGKLVIIVTGAAVDFAQEGGQFVPALPERVPALAADDVPAQDVPAQAG